MFDNKLKRPAFSLLTVKDIKPRGWLLQQLRIQAAGLSGNLDKFWPDVKDSAWIGGTREGWERVPYWLDGFIPLAFLLDDEDMKSRAKYYIDYILSHQCEDGWLCPTQGAERGSYDVWAVFLILKVLVEYHNATGDERIEGAVSRALQSLDRHIDFNTLFGWGMTRWFECLISIWWLYERTGGEWLLSLASKLRGQGFDWISFFRHWPYRQPDPKGRWSQMSHVVNNAMMLKSGPLLWRMTGEREHLDSPDEMIALLDEYHGMVTGIFTGDECLAGKSPVHGTELCAVGEMMYSAEHIAAITGSVHWTDRLEMLAFNALPATFSPDMWTHQYDQQVNQVECSIQTNAIFNTNGGEANLFGLEPNYGCCTANLSQPWPKFALSTFMGAPDGIAAVAYAPASAVFDIKGRKVRAELITDYPFSEELKFCVSVPGEVEFDFQLRIPHWAEGASITIDGEEIPVKSGEYYHLKRLWKDDTCFVLRLPMMVRVVERPNNLYSIVRGPLVFAYPVKEQWKQVHQDIEGREFPHCDYEVLPAGPWNYGLCIDKDNPLAGITFEQRPLGECPYSPEGAPVIARVKARRVEWSMENGHAREYPEMSVISDEIEEIVLIPYGCTNLRVTEMPIVG